VSQIDVIVGIQNMGDREECWWSQQYGLDNCDNPPRLVIATARLIRGAAM
jgi:hypothetical protein